MILYHGTNQNFCEIDLMKSKPNKDFGQGFYLSREYAQAMEMAKTKVAQLMQWLRAKGFCKELLTKQIYNKL
jgi:hypothetical protein